MAWLLAVAAGAADPAAAVELAAGYVDAAYARYGGGPADGGQPDSGGAIALRLPAGKNWFLTASAQRLGPYVNEFGTERPEEERRAIGVGLRRGSPDDELYARLAYIDIANWRYYNGRQFQGRGGALSIGSRHLFGPLIEGTLEGGLGLITGDGGRAGSFAARGELALRFGPGVSAYAAYLIEDDAFVHVGLRANFGATGAKPPAAAVRAAEPGSGPLLAVGRSLIAVRPLQLQARPAYGAPETVVVPQGEALEVLETTQNEFGNWWRVSWGEQEGWIREGWLTKAD